MNWLDEFDDNPDEAFGSSDDWVADLCIGDTVMRTSPRGKVIGGEIVDIKISPAHPSFTRYRVQFERNIALCVFARTLTKHYVKTK